MSPKGLVSMTGFGRAAGPVGGRRMTVEVQSVNHRTLAVKLRMPEALAPLERSLREQVERGVARGSVTVSLDWSDPETPEALEVSIAAAAAYVRQIRAAAKRLDVDLSLTAGDLLGLPGVLRPPRGRTLPAIGSRASALLAQALAQFARARRAEGKALAGAIGKILASLNSRIAEIEGRQPEAAAQAAARLKKRLADLMAGQNLSDGDLLREAAIHTGRADTTEEIARIRSHCAQIREHLGRGGPVGRSLDFLCQELVRETNTLAAKLQSADLVATAIAAKADVEKLREQAANIE